MIDVYRIKERQINTPLARTFRAIVTAGWANESDGNVEAPTGHFAYVTIEENEVSDVLDAIGFDEDFAPIFPGAFIVMEDSDGNTELIEFSSNALAAFRALQRDYAIWNASCPKCGNEGPHKRLAENLHRCVCGETWDPTEPFRLVPGWRPEAISTVEDEEPEKPYLVCRNCGEAFDDIVNARDHGTADLSGSAGWCGDEGFDIAPESEAF